jgi:hypothetical protein
MRKAIDYLRTHPVIAVAIVVGIVGALYLVLTTPRASAPRAVAPVAPVAAPPPATVAPPAGPPAPAAPPSPGAPAPVAAPSPRAPGAVEAGRPDPFSPIVQTGPGGAPAPVPPPAPLPPPLFPGQPGQPGQPAAPPSPEPPPKEASTAQLVGILGDTSSVAIIRLGNETYIVSPGDLLRNKIKVTAIDFNRGLVVLEEEGERFELKMGGVNGAHVAVAQRLGNV